MAARKVFMRPFSERLVFAAQMDIPQYYLASFFGILAMIGAYQSWLLILRYASQNLAFLFTRYIQYPLFVTRRYWGSVTRLQALCLAAFVVGNCLSLSFNVDGARALEQRAGLVAVVNAVPLFLGGRTNPLADLLGISLPSYYLAHHWIGRVVAVEALIHAVVVLALRPRPGPIAVSGLIVFIGLSFILISTPWVCRRLLSALFPHIHVATVLAVMVGLAWHVALLPSIVAKATVFTSVGLWLSTSIVRMIIILFRGRRVSVQAITEYGDITQLKVHAHHAMRSFPGAYFYVHFPGQFWNHDMVNSYPMMVMWDEATEPSVSSLTQSKDFSFLVTNNRNHASGLQRLEYQSYLLLEGPYGQDLPLQEFENVILVAQGIGLIGLLPFALHLARRREHDNRVRQSLQGAKKREKQLKEAEKEWSEKTRELSLSEETLATKFQDLSNKKWPRRRWETRLAKELEEEARSLERERKLADREKMKLEKERVNFNDNMNYALSTALFNDSTRKIDVFWQLDHNDQGKWAARYLQELQDLDPSHKMVIILCKFPSPKSRNTQPLFKNSEYCKSVYPKAAQVPFSEEVASKIRSEAQSPGKTVVVACGEAPFTEKMRDAVVDVTRPDRLVRFSEVEFRPRGTGKASHTRASHSSDLTVTPLSNTASSSSFALSDGQESDAVSFITQRSSSSFDMV